MGGFDDFKFDRRTLEKLAELICGDNLAEKYCEDFYKDCPLYRTGSQLRAFFINSGLECPAFEGTRKWWVVARLEEYNNNSLMRKVILHLVDPKEYFDSKASGIVIKEVNKLLTLDGFAIVPPESGPNSSFIIISGNIEIPDSEDDKKRSIPMPDFSEIISDNNLVKVLDNRWCELESCMNSEAFLSSIILMGSILEGALLLVVENNPRDANLSNSAPKNRSGQILRFKDWTLNDLINVTHECGWIGKDVRDFNDKLRDYRNLVHPRKQRDENFFPDEGTCKICLEVVRAALNDLKNV